MSELAPDEMFCPTCGVVIHESTNFCPECGAENDAYEAEGSPPGNAPPGGRPGDGAPVDAPPGGAAPAGPPPDPAPSGKDRLVDREWDALSSEQAVAGLKSGFYAAWTGLVATLWVSTLTLLSLLGDLLGGNADLGGVPVGAPRDGLSARAGTDLILTGIQAAQDPWTTVVKFFGWIFYSANFVPITIDFGQRSADIDLVAGLGSFGASPILFRIAVVFVLFVFGYRAAGSIGYDSFPEAAGAGATVAIGYLAVLVPGTFLVGVSGGGGGISPNLVLTVAFAGGIAAVVGACGGLTREYTRRGA